MYSGHAHHHHPVHDADVLSEQERKAQTKMIMRLFELWSLTNEEQAICLGLSTKTGTNIRKYKMGLACLPQYRDIQERIKLLLLIHKHLRTLFPRNDEIVYEWIKLPNRFFENFRPFDVINRDGILGLDAIRQYLEKALEI